MATITTSMRAQVAQLYVAYFGRAPDKEGMEFWAQQLADGVPLRAVAETMFATTPARAYFPTGASNESIARSLYVNTLGREPDAQGLAFWTDKLNEPGASPAVVLSEIVNVVMTYTGTDPAGLASAALFANRAEVARYYAEKGGSIAGATTALANVTQDPASVTAAKAVIDGGSVPPAPPPSFAVSKDGSNIVSFVDAGAQVAVSEASGTFTFTSSGGTTGTGTVTGTVAGVLVPAATTFSISSALAAGMAFTGAGTTLVVANAAGEDLTAFTATGVTGIQLTTGQNYTLTAAQAAIGRIGAGGAAGTLTDGGTITVKDTLAALASVATALKTAGADSVIASAAPGDISATAVGGIDSIVLAAGNYTMTAAQAALANGTTGSQIVTLTTLASGTLAATVESFVLGNFANNVTLGAAAQNVSSPIGTATTLTIGGTTPAGTWALANGGDVLVATDGANITGVNNGAATTAENLTLTGGITMTRDQHEAPLAITAGGGTDSVTITTNGIVTPRAGVEKYFVAQAGTSNTVSVSADVAGVNITGDTGNATVVVDTNVTATGNWSLNGTSDGLSAAAGANISGVNGGLATTAKSLNLTGAITMTQAQHQGFTSFTALGGSDEITITDGGAITAGTGINSYVLSAGGANAITVLGGVTGISGSSNKATSVIVAAGLTVSGTWTLDNALDVITAANGSSIAGVNGGADTKAETLNITGTVSMTVAQHGATAIAVGSSTDVAKITTGGTVIAKILVGNYNLSSVASNTLVVNASKLDVGVAGAAGFATTVDVGAQSASGTWALAHATGDTIKATNGAVLTGINSGGLTTAEILEITGGGTVTMTAAQHNPLAITAGGTETLTITGGGTLSAKTGIETYKLQGGVTNLTVVAGTTAVNLTGVNDGLGAVNVTIGGLAVNGTWSLASAPDTIFASTGANISGVNFGAATTAENLNLTGGIIMTQAQYAGLTSITAISGSDSITITSGGAVTARAGVETYTVSSGASNNVFVLAATNVNGDAANATTVSVASGQTVTGSYVLGHLTNDMLETETGANIAGANTSGVERLTLNGSLVMRANQYAAFNSITGVTGNDTIIFTTALSGEILSPGVKNFTLFAANNTVNLGASGQLIDGGAMTAGQVLSVGGGFAATVALAALAGGDLSAGSATGGLTVTAGTGANTIITGTGNDTVNAGDGDDLITGGNGVDTLFGENGNDTLYYGSMGQFLSGVAVIDQINGGADTDTVEITGAVVLTTSADLARVTDVERITARAQSGTQYGHSVVFNSDARLHGVNTIDLSGDTTGASSATLTFIGVNTAMTLKGVGVGINNIAGGSGADTLVGGNGADFFYYTSAASFITGTAVVDSIDGGGGIDSITVVGPLTVTSAQSLARITHVENLRVEINAGSARAYSLTIQSDANLGSISTIDLVYDQATGSTATVDLTGVSRAVTVTGVNQGTNIITGGSGDDTLSGGRVNDTFRGGAGNDAINTIALTGLATYVFESTAGGNGSDTLDGVRSNGKFDFRGFLGATSVLTAAVDATVAAASLDLTGNNIGVRFGSAALSSTDILTARNDAVAGDVVVADNGKAVVFSFSGNSGSNANGSIYYVEDTDATGGQTWAVTIIGTMSGSAATVTQIASSGMFL